MKFLQKMKRLRNYEKNHSKDDNFIVELLREKEELDWLEFKRNYKLFVSNGKVSPHSKDEFIKDILGLANGNTRIIKRYKYLLIGADDSKFDENQQRVLHNVDYKIPSLSEISKWLKDTVTPSIVGIEMREVTIQDKKIIIITIPPTFHLHETTRELVTKCGTFQKPTVFMRQNEHTVPAGVHDGVAIMDLKHLFRQEIANPPAVLIGLLIGAFVSFFISSIIADSKQVIFNVPKQSMLLVYTIIGSIFGGGFGWVIKILNSTRFEWKFMSKSEKIIMLFIVSGTLLIYFFLINK
ncbi:MAG: putative DNA binding domain-containing protein [Anaerolineaceae bacterium]|nr:putative DNA binding domain-containing protein [Anaerolineaceae bacterium]